MKVLVLGGDGRAHALAWKLLNSPLVTELVCAPGNGGTAPLVPSVDLDEADAPAVARWAFDEMFDLIVPASSRALHAGLVEEVLSLRIGICAPAQRSTVLEQSRCRAKEFMLRHGLPTAPGRAFAELGMAERYLATQPLPVMIKADHPAGGEEFYTDRYAALEGLRALFMARPPEAERGGVVIESYLKGPRVVLSALTDGRAAVPLLATRLYDRVEEGDAGALAPGIGAHTGASAFAQQLTEYLHKKLIEPIVAGMAQEGLPYWGFLGIDCIITADGPRLTAIRCGLHEGEAEVVLPRLDEDLLPWLQASIAQRLHEMPPPRWLGTPSVGLGLFARGYPTSFPYGGAIRGLEELDEGVLAFHNATANPAVVLPYTPRQNRSGGLNQMLGKLFGMSGVPATSALHSTGGMVLTVVAHGATLAGARGRGLINAERVQFEGRTFRGDIGAKEFG